MVFPCSKPIGKLPHWLTGGRSGSTLHTESNYSLVFYSNNKIDASPFRHFSPALNRKVKINSADWRKKLDNRTFLTAFELRKHRISLKLIIEPSENTTVIFSYPSFLFLTLSCILPRRVRTVGKSNCAQVLIK